MLYNIKNAIAYIAEKQYLCTRITNLLIIAIMKEKLTKNVSISSGEMSAGVINAAFFALLSRNGLYLDYFHYWAERYPAAYGMTISQAWENWSKISTPAQYIAGAFNWAESSVPRCAWVDIDTKWRVWLSENLNK